MPHRPSVDVLFRSAAETFRHRTLGVVLTGMGSDGKQGAAWIKAQAGMVFTEAEDTCIVYGMNCSVVEAGLADRSVPLDKIAEAFWRWYNGQDSRCGRLRSVSEDPEEDPRTCRPSNYRSRGWYCGSGALLRRQA